MASPNHSWLRLAALGPQFIAATLTGWAIGKFVLDPYLDTYPAFTVTGILVGTVFAFIYLFKELNSLNRPSNKNDD